MWLLVPFPKTGKQQVDIKALIGYKYLNDYLTLGILPVFLIYFQSTLLTTVWDAYN